MVPIDQRTKDLARLVELIESSERIVLLPHTAPDGDALGSTLALRRILGLRYPQKNIEIVSPDYIEGYLSWMPGVEELKLYPDSEFDALELLGLADLIVNLDHNVVSRLRYAPLVEACRESRSPRVLIDHHLDPSDEFLLAFSYPAYSSTCHLLYDLLTVLGWVESVDRVVATQLLTGIITDTGRFMYNCLDPRMFEVVGGLVGLGADYAGIVDMLSYHGRVEQLRIQGYALHEKLELYPELQTAIITLTQDELRRFAATKGDTEGLVNLPLSVEGVNTTCLIREDKGQVKLSMRSIGDIAVNVVASQGFGGGGHLNAAGAEHQGSVEEAKNIYLYEIKRLLGL